MARFSFIVSLFLVVSGCLVVCFGCLMFAVVVSVCFGFGCLTALFLYVCLFLCLLVCLFVFRHCWVS